MQNTKLRQKHPFIPQTPCSKVILDVDTGCDDAQAIVALIHLAKKYNKQILGITCTYGNTTLQNVALNVLICVRQCNQNIKIYKGSKNNILGNHKMDLYFGEDGLNHKQKQFKQQLNQKDYDLIQSQNAFSFISRSVKQYPNQVAIIMTGPVTNLALAYLIDNQIPNRIGSLTIMGGSSSGVGLNQTFSAQFNFNGDPEAIHIVLMKFKNILLLPFDIAFQYKSDPRCFTSEKNQRGKFIKRIFDSLEFFVCDPIALFPVFIPNSIKYIYDIYGQIVLQGQRTRGYLALDWIPKQPRDNNLKIIAQVDQELINGQLLQSVQ